LPGYHVIDSSALLAVAGCTDPAKHLELCQRLTELVDEEVLRFPRAVVKELEVLGRSEPITFWATGLGKKINRFNADVGEKVTIMQIFQLDMGYDAGLEDMDGGDPTIVELAAAGQFLQERRVEFWMISEDRGSTPLRPTMEEVCAQCGWAMLGIHDGLKSLGLEDYLIEQE
jgi:hypothetical protein